MLGSNYKAFIIFISLFLSSCGSNLAPVSELKWHPDTSNVKTHIVRRGETLYAIAFRYDTDYRTLARLNHIQPPFSLRIGQKLHLKGQQSVIFKSRSRPLRQINVDPAKNSQLKPVHSPAQRYAHGYSGWLWPVSGRVVTSFIPDQGKKGINIACTKGEKVIASSAGIVAYAGNGLAGYGNLIIIKHQNEYLTAYGHNARMMVKEGQAVKAGQIIAESGIIEHKYYGVHFEIRKAGSPVNPLNYLKKG